MIKTDIIALLNHRLQHPLPGYAAQLSMEPESRKLFNTNIIDPRESAVLILLFRSKKEVYFPIIRRPVYNGHHSGQMALPGGKRELNDIDLCQTALRESCEEIGICQSSVEIIGQLTNLYIPVSDIMVTPFIGYINTFPQFTIDNIEVDELFCISLPEFLDGQARQTEQWPFNGNYYNVPFYKLQNQKVWGATAMILSEFEFILRETGLSKPGTGPSPL